MTNEKGYMLKAVELPETGDLEADGKARLMVTKEGAQAYMDKFTDLLNTLPKSDMPIIVFALTMLANDLEAQLDMMDKIGLELFRATIGSTLIGVKVP